MAVQRSQVGIGGPLGIVLGLLLGMTPTPVWGVMYRVTFESTWNRTDHPRDFPANPHFSALVGGTHLPTVSFWEPGGLASPGMESMAERGGTTVLRQEIEKAISLGQARTTFVGSGLGAAPASTSLTFDLAPTDVVTLVSMIAPSPDWFVGVHGLNLRPAGYWLRSWETPLHPYDAGTDSGVTFTSADIDTVPRQPITRLDLLSNSVLADTPPLGRFVWELLTPSAWGDLNTDGTVDARDAERLFGAWGTSNREADVNEDGWVDAADADVMFAQWTGDSVPAASVPEPSGLALGAGTWLGWAAIRAWRRRS